MKRVRQIFLAFLTLLCLSVTAKAQFYSNGQDASSVRWRIIRTDTFSIVYPSGMDSLARQLGSMMQWTARNTRLGLPPSDIKTKIILHPSSVVSNANVAWAPKRMEFYPTPGQNSYAQDWLAQLSLHEYRHHLQLSAMNRSFGRALHLLLGQQADAGLLGLYVPFWFLEGDAVMAETAYSFSGRGRTPSFTMPLMAQVLEKGIYSYDKAVMGSYKHFVPDHYVLGYQLVGWGQMKYGKDMWSAVLENVARTPYSVNPFSREIKKQTGKHKRFFYMEALEEIKNEWASDPIYAPFAFLDTVSPNKNGEYILWETACYVNDSVIASIEEGPSSRKGIILIENNKKIKKIIPGSIFRTSLSFGNGKLVWAEKISHCRWENVSWSDIVVYDLLSGKRERISKRQRLFCPAISADGKRISAIEIKENNEASLVVFDAETAKRIKEWKAPSSWFLQSPHWDEKGENLICVVQTAEGKSLLKYHVQLDSVELLKDFSYTEISKPVLYRDLVFFSSALSSKDQIHYLDLSTGKEAVLTHADYGAFDPEVSFDGKKMLWHEYTADGYIIVEAFLDSMLQNATYSVGKPSFIIADKNAVPAEDRMPVRFEPIKHKSKPYRKFLHLFNIHSWGPVSVDADETEIGPGLSFLSQNVLSTSFLNAGYQWDYSTKESRLYASYAFKGFFPVFEANYHYTFRRMMDEGEIIQWNEQFEGLESSMPLRWNMHQHYFGFFPSAFVGNIDVIKSESSPENMLEENYLFCGGRIAFTHQMAGKERDLLPYFAQLVELNYRRLSEPLSRSGEMFSTRTIFYFPGVFRHDGFRITAGYQQSSPDFFAFGNMVPAPRETLPEKNRQLRAITADYAVPLLNPDFSLSSLIYLKRVKATFFVDYAWMKLETIEKEKWSLGTDLRLDFHALRFLAPIDAGLRTAWLPEQKKWAYSFLFAIDFYDI